MKSLLLASLALSVPLAARAAPEAVWLANASIRAQVSPTYPVVLQYERKPAGARFQGAPANGAWSISLIRPDRSVADVPPTGVRVTPTPGAEKASYAFECSLDGRAALRFMATVSLEGDEVVTRIG